MKLSEVQRGVKLSSLQKKAEPQYRVTDDMSTTDRLLAGIGGGMYEAVRKGTNFVLPDALTPEWASDEAIAEQARIDKDLDSTGAGMAGKILGQTAISAPVGGAAGGVLKGALAASKGARGAALLKAARGYGPGRAAVEGAVEGAMLANPDERLEGAAFGGASGGIIGGAAALGGKAADFLTPTKSGKAKSLQYALMKQGVSPEDAWAGISHGAEDGLWKQFYEGVVANLPGGASKVRGQFENLEQSVRQAAMRKAAPWVAEENRLYRPPLGQILQHGEDVQTGLRHMDKLWDDAWAVSRRIDGIKLPNGWKVPDVLREFVEGKGGSIPSGTASGRQLIDLKESANMVISKLKTDKNLSLWERKQLYSFIEDLDRRIAGKIQQLSNLPQNSPYRAAAEAYRRNLSGYSDWLKLKDAATSAGGRSKFSAEQLVNAATSFNQRGMFGEGGKLQDFGKLAGDVAKPFQSRPGIYQMAAAMGLLGGGVGGGYSNPDNPILGGAMGAAQGLGGLYVAGSLLGSRAMQRRLMGEFSKPEQLMAEALRRSGRLARSATIPAYLENQDEP